MKEENDRKTPEGTNVSKVDWSLDSYPIQPLSTDALLSSGVLQLLRTDLVFLQQFQPTFPFLSLLPFTTVGDGEWVTLLDDGNPRFCRQRILTNSSDSPMEFEVTWKREQNPVETFVVNGKSSMILECTVRKLRVKGQRGERGTWEEAKSAPFIRLSGSGVAYHDAFHEPKCRTFEVRNGGKAKITIRMKRNGADVDPIEVHPGNMVTLRCKISRLEIDREPDDQGGLSYIKEIEEPAEDDE